MLVVERRRDLESKVIVRIVETTGLGSRILDRRPLAADDGEEHPAGFELAPDDVDEVLTRRNVIGVFEDAVGAETLPQRAQQRPDKARRVLAAIADEDARG